MERQQLLHPELLRVGALNGGFYVGGAQAWFKDSWRRTSGCGPTTASGMLWYLARSRCCTALCETGETAQSDFLTLMNTMFDHITPSMMGVDSTDIFADGIVRYGKRCGIRLQTRVLDILPKPLRRPPGEALRDFILESLKADSPIAFLNLSNGTLTNLDSWHWVMLTALEPDSMTATICDHGAAKEINIGEWLSTTALGGGFVSIIL